MPSQQMLREIQVVSRFGELLMYYKIKINAKIKMIKADADEIFAFKVLALSTQEIQFNEIKVFQT